MNPVKIGDIKIRIPIFLAPMLDVTDLPYRLLCRKAGAGMAYTEMLYTSAILHKNKKTKDMMKTCKEDKPIGVQVTGKNRREFKQLIPFLEKYDLIDINAGCPSVKISENQAGAYLLKSPEKIAKIIKALKPAGIPVTVKIRLGYSKKNTLKIAKTIEKAGADAITIHARTAIQSNSTPADWNEIKKAKDNLSIPLIGNGDINSGKKAAEMLEIADGAMIGRAAIGNPLIFKQINYYLKTGKEKPATIRQNIKQFNQYLKLAKKYKLIDINKIKYLGSNFLKGFNDASKLRNKLMSLKSYSEIQNFISSIKNN